MNGMNKGNMNLYNDHPLIPREQTFVLDRKLITIHSEDRDICSWPNPSNFEIILPQSYKNVQSIRLIEGNFPSIHDTFTNYNQNTKMSFFLAAYPGYIFTITIDEGFYTPIQLQYELTNRMNKAVTSFLGASYTGFVVVYNEVNQKLWFGNKTEAFKLLFDKIEDYSQVPYPTNCGVLPPNSINPCNSTNWGLPYYLGFDKLLYTATQTTSALNLEYKAKDDSDYNWLPANGYYIQAPNMICILGETCFYMELSHYNDLDELKPWPLRTNAIKDNTYNGIVKAAFAKIPIVGVPISQYFDSRNGLLQNFSQFWPPLERIQKLKIKFRYHDGRLVDFGHCNFNFTLEFDCYRDEIARELGLRVPAQVRM